MKIRQVQTSFWKDNYISELSAKEKLVFIYLITNDSVSLTGMYQLPDRMIRAELDLTQPELEAIKIKFVKDSKFYFLNGWIKIINYDKYNAYTGDKNKEAKAKELQFVPKELLNHKFSDTLSGGYSENPETLDTTSNQLSVISNQYSVIGVVKGNDVTEETMRSIAELYQVPYEFVLSKHDDMMNWCKAKGKKYKDYDAALRNWVKKDAIERREKHGERTSKSRIEYVGEAL